MAYGVQIRNSSGTLTLDTSTRVANVISSGTVSITASTSSGFYWLGTSSSIALTGMTTSNTGEYDVWLANNPSGIAATLLEGCTINRGTNSFTVTYQSFTQNSSVTLKYMGFRY
jgi:hypothetical protein